MVAQGGRQLLPDPGGCHQLGAVLKAADCHLAVLHPLLHQPEVGVEPRYLEVEAAGSPVPRPQHQETRPGQLPRPSCVPSEVDQ